MSAGQLIFSQIIGHLPMHTFRRCVQQYRGNHHIRIFSCLDQFLCMAFAQLTYRESLRDIEACLRAQQSKLYHMGIRGQVSRSALADANERRDWGIYADFAQSLIHIARKLDLDDEFGGDLDPPVYLAKTVQSQGGCGARKEWEGGRVEQRGQVCCSGGNSLDERIGAF